MSIHPIWLELSSYSLLEMFAVIASALYILLAANNNRWCWPAAFVGSAIFAVVFWRYALFMDSALNVYYTTMAVYGWIIWNRATKDGSDAPIRKITLAFHGYALLGILLLTLISGYWLSKNTVASFPYLDSFTTWASLLATWMIAKKYIENWLYWIVIDSVSIYLYINKSLFFTVVLFAFYIAMSIAGYYKWRKQLYAAAVPT